MLGPRKVKPKPGNCKKLLIESLAQPIAPLCVLLLSLGLTGLAWYYAANSVKRDAQSKFERQVSESTSALKFRLQTYINTLRASQALFAASQSVDRDEWKIFARSLDIQTTYPGINGIGFIRYVPKSRKAAYERQVRQDTSIDPNGYPDFAIKPAGGREDYFVIEYIEPLAPNRPAMGLDVGGDPVRRAAVIRARDTGEAAATKRIILVQDATKKPGLLILLPVYRHDLPHNTVEEKRRALLGFVFVPLRTTSLIEEALPEVIKQDLALKVYNGKDLMYASDRIYREKNSNAIRLHQTTTLDVAGETWQLYFTSQQASGAFWASTPILVLAGGTIISFLIFGIMRSLIFSRRRAQQLATEMTAELTKANAELKTEITERKQTEQALQESESTLRSFFDSAAMMMGIVEVFEDDILHISDNAATAEFFGSTPEAMCGKFATKMGASQEQVQKWLGRYRESELSNSPVRFEYLHDSETNSAWLAATVCAIAPLPDGRSRFSYIVEDITERKRSQEQIAVSLAEKEVLLKEIHHRVKNNLQVICSLLNLQARSLQDTTITALFKETQNRIRSMALVHEKLYQSNNLAKIELVEYLQDLAQNLSFSYPVDYSKVIFKTDIQSNIFLNIDTAVPCGLIVSELISNALKYAFYPGEKGEIYLQAWLNEEQNLVLIVQDSGRGFPDDFELEKSQTLGLKLVKTLTHQLRGNLELDKTSGTKFKVLLTQINR